MALRFLADTNFDQRIVAGVVRAEPSISFQLPHGVIPPRMPDPEVLSLAAQLDRILVTHDARTMPWHFAAFQAHSESPGVILVPRLMPIGEVVEQLLLIALAANAGEWQNLWRRLPL